MDIFNLLSMIGGLALFLYGMHTMGEGLAKLSGGRLEQILEKLTSRKIMAVLLGAGVTAVIQSSSATTVMVVGFVNSGIMKLQQAVGIIMGANVGTTATSWILSLAGLEGSNIWVRLLKPSSFSPILAMMGVLLLMMGKKDRQRDIGTILLGFAVLMTGMEAMSTAVKPLASNENFTGILLMFRNPILGLLAGAVLTAVIQSSSASVGILQALCATGAVPFATALPIIMGQNIGTCITAILSSAGASKNAKRASMIHLYFNLIGTFLFMIVFYTVNAFVRFAFLDQKATAAGIAVVHSLFNVGAVLVLFPFSNQLVRLARLTIPSRGEETRTLEEQKPEALAALDERFLDKPAFAMELSKSAAVQMAVEAKRAIEMALELLVDYKKENAERIIALEQSVDQYEDVLGSYLVKLSSRDLSKTDSRTLTILLHCMSDFERISDHAVNLVEKAEEMEKGGLKFSRRALEELSIFSAAVKEIVEKAVMCFEENNLSEAGEIEPLEQVIDLLNREIKERHIRRLRKGKCTMELGLILQDISNNFERVADHCSNIGVCLIQVSADGFETHEYLGDLKEENSEWYKRACRAYQDKYQLPIGKTDKIGSDKKIETDKKSKEKNEKGKNEKGKDEKGKDIKRDEQEKEDIKKNDKEKNIKKDDIGKDRKKEEKEKDGKKGGKEKDGKGKGDQDKDNKDKNSKIKLRQEIDSYDE